MSWTIKKAELWKPNALKLWCWEESRITDWKSFNPKGNQSWVFIGRIDAEAETPILWPPDAKNWLIWKDPDAGKDWGREEKGMTEDEMFGWHHQLSRHEFEQALGVGDGQGSLACRSPWGHKELDMTEQLNWNESNNLEAAIEKSCQQSLRPTSLPVPSVAFVSEARRKFLVDYFKN